MFVYDSKVPPLKQWLALAYSIYREYSFRLFQYTVTVILSKRK